VRELRQEGRCFGGPQLGPPLGGKKKSLRKHKLHGRNDRVGIGPNLGLMSHNLQLTKIDEDKKGGREGYKRQKPQVAQGTVSKSRPCIAQPSPLTPVEYGGKAKKGGKEELQKEGKTVKMHKKRPQGKPGQRVDRKGKRTTRNNCIGSTQGLRKKLIGIKRKKNSRNGYQQQV